MQGVPDHKDTVDQDGGLLGLKRALQAADEVTVVETAEALQEAISEGKPHIEIRTHLDLTTLDVDVDLEGFIFSIQETTKSIRVRICYRKPGVYIFREPSPKRCSFLAGRVHFPNEPSSFFQAYNVELDQRKKTRVTGPCDRCIWCE